MTGGGLAANLARVLPAALSAAVDRGSWTPAPVFDLVARAGSVERAELEATLNMGVGMVAVVAWDAADAAVRLLTEREVPAWVCGEVADTPGGGVTLRGRHR